MHIFLVTGRDAATVIRQCVSAGQSAQHVCTPNAPACAAAQNAANFGWPRGVTGSTLESESSDRGSNPRGASCQYRGRPHIIELLHDERRSSAHPSALNVYKRCANLARTWAWKGGLRGG
jgi:hypothetical protein